MLARIGTQEASRDDNEEDARKFGRALFLATSQYTTPHQHILDQLSVGKPAAIGTQPATGARLLDLTQEEQLEGRPLVVVPALFSFYPWRRNAAASRGGARRRRRRRRGGYQRWTRAARVVYEARAHGSSVQRRRTGGTKPRSVFVSLSWPLLAAAHRLPLGFQLVTLPEWSKGSDLGSDVKTRRFESCR